MKDENGWILCKDDMPEDDSECYVMVVQNWEGNPRIFMAESRLCHDGELPWRDLEDGAEVFAWQYKEGPKFGGYIPIPEDVLVRVGLREWTEEEIEKQEAAHKRLEELDEASREIDRERNPIYKFLASVNYWHRLGLTTRQFNWKDNFPQEQYAGYNSEAFWEMIGSLDHDSKEWDELYGLGVDLQNLEHEVLEKLRRAMEAKDSRDSEVKHGK